MATPLKKTIRASEQDRPDVARAREEWKLFAQTVDPRRLIFLDETGATTKMGRRYGRSLQGKRLVSTLPYGHWQTTTFIAGLRFDSLTAPFVLDGPMDGTSFRTYVEKVLVPTLRPGDIVVLDNLQCHKVSGVETAIRAVGADIRYLPPYSPDFNPIEMFFSKLKSLLRKAANRTREDLWSCIGELLSVFSPDECLNYFEHSGYSCRT